MTLNEIKAILPIKTTGVSSKIIFITKFLKMIGAENDAKPRFWANISNKGYKNGKETDEYIQASIPVNMTGNAAEFFKDHAKQTKNTDVDICVCRLKNGWLKAVEGKEDNYLVLVCHELAEIEKKETEQKNRRH